MASTCVVVSLQSIEIFSRVMELPFRCAPHMALRNFDYFSFATYMGVIMEQSFLSKRGPNVADALRQSEELQNPEGDSAPRLLDGSVEGMVGFLGELVELADQRNNTFAEPALELRFGDITTITSVSRQTDQVSLSIKALLPAEHHDASRPMSTPNGAGNWNVAWNGDQGGYVVTRNLPLGQFSDERSVFDAVMDTSDAAAAWQSSGKHGKSGF